MNTTNLSKLISVIAFLVLLILIFSLYFITHNLKVEINSSELSFSGFYLLLTLILIVSAIIFILSYRMMSDYSRELHTIDKEIDVLASDENTTLTEDVEITGDIKSTAQDKEEFEKKIIAPIKDTKNIEKYSDELLKNIANKVEGVIGLLFLRNEDDFNITGKYAYFAENEPDSFKLGESLSGQAAKNKTLLNLTELPDDYISVVSGLGTSRPKNLIIVPLIHDDQTIGIIEIGSFKKFSEKDVDLFNYISPKIADKLINLTK